MMDDSYNNIMFSSNMWDQSSNVILDTYIRDDKHSIMAIG